MVENNNQADDAAIRSWHKEVEDAVNNGDYDAYSSHWADDMIWMAPHMPVMHGKQECLEMFKRAVATYHCEQNVTIEEIVVTGDIAFSRVFSKERLVPKGNAEPMVNDGKNIFTFRRNPDGSWLGRHCIWNSNTPPETSGRFDKLME